MVSGAKCELFKMAAPGERGPDDPAVVTSLPEKCEILSGFESGYVLESNTRIKILRILLYIFIIISFPTNNILLSLV